MQHDYFYHIVVYVNNVLCQKSILEISFTKLVTQFNHSHWMIKTILHTLNPIN